MKIVLNLISTKGVSGGGQIARNFLHYTLRGGDEIEWYYFLSEELAAADPEGVAMIPEGRLFLLSTQPQINTYFQVRRRLRELEAMIRPDLIYTVTAPCYHFFRTKEVMRFANAWVTNPNRYAWRSMNFIGGLRLKLYCMMQRLLLRRCTYFITQSSDVKKGLSRITHQPESHIEVVPNVVPYRFTQYLVEKKAKKDGLIHIVTVASDNPHKNVDIIPFVASKLKDGHGLDNVCFHVTLPVNSPVFLRMQKDAVSLDVENMIINHGECTQIELAELYSGMDICFFPSLLETFSAALVEALYFGLPIVATDFGFNREVTRDAALYFAPADAGDAANSLARLVGSPKLQAELCEAIGKRLKLYNDYGKHYFHTINFLKSIK